MRKTAKSKAEAINLIILLEQTLERNYNYNSTDIMVETEIRGYEWSETFNDLKNMGYDVSSLKGSDVFYGFDLRREVEVTVFDYVDRLYDVLEREISETLGIAARPEKIDWLTSTMVQFTEEGF